MEKMGKKRDQIIKYVYLSWKVKYGRIAKPERVVFDRRPPVYGRVQSLRVMPLR